MSDNRNNRAGNGKHPNSPRYSEKYGKGHVNPYLGAQPRQEDVFREIEERQNAVRRENEQDVRGAEAGEAADLSGSTQPGENSGASRTARSTARRRTRDYTQPRVMDDPQMKKRLREIQEQAMSEARAFRSAMYPNGEDFDEGDLSPDIKMKLSEDNKPLIALESRGRDGRLEIKWIPVVLSDEDMEAFFPAIEPAKDSRGIELEDNNELRRTDDNHNASDEDDLVLIPIAGLDDESPEEDGTAPGAAAEIIDMPQTADTEADLRASIIEELPFVELEPQDDSDKEAGQTVEASEETEPEESSENAEEESGQVGEDDPEQPADEEQTETEQETPETSERPEDSSEESSEPEAENEAPGTEDTGQPADEEKDDSADEAPGEENAEEAAADQPEEETQDASVMQDSQQEDDPEKIPERKKHKRRRSRPTDAQMPIELNPEESPNQEETPQAETVEEQPLPNRRTAVVSRMNYDGMMADSRYGDGSGQDDTLFLRRKRPGMVVAYGQGMAVQSPRYINDDDFVERWLGNEEEEDMASESKRRRRRISTLIGAVTMVLALIGFIAVARWGIGLLSGIGNTDGQKTEYAEFISPIVMSEVPVFEAWDAIPQDKLLQSAVFSVLLEMDVSYERDDTGKFIIPSTDIVNAVKSLYGAYSDDPTQDEEINTQIRNALYGSAGEDTTNTDVYYVDLEDSFHVADGLSGPAPQVVDISRRDNSITLTVQYLEDLEGGSGGILYSRQYILTLSEDGYYVQAIREYDE